jgi:transposase-like protein
MVKMWYGTLGELDGAAVTKNLSEKGKYSRNRVLLVFFVDRIMLVLLPYFPSFPMPSNRYTAEFRAQAVARLLAPNSSLTQVSRDLGCSVNALQAWRKRHRQQNSPPPGHACPASFIPVNVVDPSHPSAEIVLPNGVIIRLPDATPRYLAELLHALVPC